MSIKIKGEGEGEAILDELFGSHFLLDYFDYLSIFYHLFWLLRIYLIVFFIFFMMIGGMQQNCILFIIINVFIFSIRMLYFKLNWYLKDEVVLDRGFVCFLYDYFLVSLDYRLNLDEFLYDDLNWHLNYFLNNLCYLYWTIHIDYFLHLDLHFFLFYFLYLYLSDYSFHLNNSLTYFWIVIIKLYLHLEL